MACTLNVVLAKLRAKIYSGCQGSFRLGPEGALDVPPGSADAFCGGPCLAETELVLRCVDGIMANFRFYNGASAADVRFALDRGCGHGPPGRLRRAAAHRSWSRRQLWRRVLLRPRGRRRPPVRQQSGSGAAAADERGRRDPRVGVSVIE
ncbi:unnamed protein product [Miscanthus lutarioriparius]|uniref:DUF7731 domain-containing protein n=1 Tax=Miscanthus lutarioriparius TaxID=422564 RepID=A0A811NW46_9POAL|nr:unnamed protein product [Miscanthus lutarioriparius]